MWHKPCRTFHPWCLCIKTRCLFPYDVFIRSLAGFGAGCDPHRHWWNRPGRQPPPVLRTQGEGQHFRHRHRWRGKPAVSWRQVRALRNIVKPNCKVLVPHVDPWTFTEHRNWPWCHHWWHGRCRQWWHHNWWHHNDSRFPVLLCGYFSKFENNLKIGFIYW